MIPHSVFLRKGCILPADVDLRREAIADNWSRIGGLTSTALDTIIRRAGWHFMYVAGSYSRTGVGYTAEEAIHQALSRALKGLTIRFNAAELELVQVRRLPLIHMATVTLQARHIQQECTLATGEDVRMATA